MGRRQTPGGFSRGKTSSAISGHPHIPCVLLLDDLANELFLSAGLGARRILTHRASGNYFLVLRQNGLLDHPPCFGVGWKSNVSVSAVALSLGRK